MKKLLVVVISLAAVVCSLLTGPGASRAVAQDPETARIIDVVDTGGYPPELHCGTNVVRATIEVEAR